MLPSRADSPAKAPADPRIDRSAYSALPFVEPMWTQLGSAAYRSFYIYLFIFCF